MAFTSQLTTGSKTRSAVAGRVVTSSAIPKNASRSQPRSVVSSRNNASAAKPEKPSRQLKPCVASATATAVAPTQSSGFVKGGRVVVMGGGVCGMFAAHQLRKYYDEVIMLERDNPTFDGNITGFEEVDRYQNERRGVPQMQQPHVLLVRGLLEMEKAIPGFKDYFISKGAVKANFPEEMGFFAPAFGYTNNDGIKISDNKLMCTRGLMEMCLRSAVLKAAEAGTVGIPKEMGGPSIQDPTLGKLTLRSGDLVDGLTWNDDKSRVTGVVLKNGETLSADYVLDCSGRSSKTPEYLSAGGRPAPPAIEINARSWYTTQLYRLHPEQHAKMKVKFLHVGFAGPKLVTRWAVMWRVEDEMWQLQLIGKYSDPQPKTFEDLLEYTKTLQAPDIYDLLKYATPVSPLRHYRRLSNFRRFYEDIDMPKGLSVAGDAVCCFSPQYGRGVTMAALAAGHFVQELDKYAKQTGNVNSAADMLPQTFQKSLVDIINISWDTVVGADLDYLRKVAPEEVPPQKEKNFIQKFMVQYFRTSFASMDDPKIAAAAIQVNELIKPPTSLFDPYIASKVLPKMLFGFGKRDTSNDANRKHAPPPPSTPAPANVAPAYSGAK